VPIVQRWIDKWTWRGYRVLTLVAMMMDYMLPKRTMSWKEAWEVYFEQNGGALFKDLARYGIKMPKWPPRSPSKRTTSAPGLEHLLQLRRRHQLPHLDAGRGRDGLAVGEVPEQLRQALPPALEFWREQAARATASTTRRCPCCARPARSRWCSPSRATPPRSATAKSTTRATSTTSAPTTAKRSSRRAREVRPGLAAGAPDLPGQLLPRGHRPDGRGLRPAGCRAEYYHLEHGRDNLDFEGSEDQKNFEAWHGQATKNI
jgi:phenol hydroxylase P3 protein